MYFGWIPQTAWNRLTPAPFFNIPAGVFWGSRRVHDAGKEFRSRRRIDEISMCLEFRNRYYNQGPFSGIIVHQQMNRVSVLPRECVRKPIRYYSDYLTTACQPQFASTLRISRFDKNWRTGNTRSCRSWIKYCESRWPPFDALSMIGEKRLPE